MRKVIFVGGARPNFMKLAPLLREIQFRHSDRLTPILVHTGQHYDAALAGNFFRDLGMSEPEYNLNVGSGTHARQTAAVMVGFEDVCLQEKPDMVVVVGDVNSTAASAITAKKLCIPVAHVEAGLRSRDQSMPEEINRMITDAISDLCFASEQSGVENLLSEGKAPDQVHLVGNVMADSLYYQLRLMPDQAPVSLQPYVAMTLHRPSNVDDKSRFVEILEAIAHISKFIPVYFAIHPRTKKMIEFHKLSHLVTSHRIHQLPPLGYRDFLHIWRHAVLVITDSGGLQEETTCLGVPCFTLRENTERPVTVEQGSNQLVPGGRDMILAAFQRFMDGERKRGQVPPLWDGRAAERIIPLLQ